MRILGGRVFTEGAFTERDVFIENGRFAASAGGETVDAAGCYVIPGLVDIHTHGAMGFDFCAPCREQFDAITEYYLKSGVTSVLATSMTMDVSGIERVYEELNGYENAGGARVMGINMEGPFFSEKKKGAQPGEHLKRPDFEAFRRLNAASGGMIRLVCVAPELDGALEFIRDAGTVCTVSLAHTAATYNEAMAGFNAGASHVTHLFNGMNGFLHREPGVIGAAADFGAYVELICDGIHVHPAAIRAVFKLFGPEKICMISDSLSCAGLKDGQYTLAGQDVTVSDGKATLADGTIAGSSINLLIALQRVVSFGVSLEDAVLACTKTPALSAGIGDSVGAIAEGFLGDCLVLDKNLALKHVIKSLSHKMTIQSDHIE